ncbi:MAG: C4-dicarboxylate transporter, DctM subunit [Clostridia bacterium]|nr:C4-dicarboxylate transporter, DctM subunit [Clostridia bacterium]
MVEVLIAVVSLIVLLLIGLPVSFALAAAGCLGMFLLRGLDPALGLFAGTPYREAASYSLLVIPMFALMAGFARHSGLTRKLFDAARAWFGHLPGGLAIGSIVASAGLGAICGSSAAAAAMMAGVSVPEMQRSGYGRKLSLGSIAIAGTLAILIPPSNTLVIYGLITEESIGKLLIAGIIPGILTAVIYSITVIIWVKLRPQEAPVVNKARWEERISSLKGVWTLLIVMLLVLGGIYTGAVTPTEASAVGAFAVLILGLFFGELRQGGLITNIRHSLNDAGRTTAMIFLIIVGAMIFGYFLTATNATQALVKFVKALPVSRSVILFAILVIYLILGCFMDQVAILFLTLPLVFPVVTALGYDPIWFGVIITKTAEIGLVTPPLGLNCYVVAGVTGNKVEEVFSGIWPLLFADLCTLALLVFVPEISLWLPNHMAG